MEAKIMFRIDDDLKKEFERITAELDITPSQLLRRHVKEFVTAHLAKTAQADLFAETKKHRSKRR